MKSGTFDEVIISGDYRTHKKGKESHKPKPYDCESDRCGVAEIISESASTCRLCRQRIRQ